jgi:hypothetical protein
VADIEGTAGDDKRVLDIGGLRFDVAFRGAGATLRVWGDVGGTWTEMLRFDDFIEEPHFHVPASGPSIAFDRALGDPLTWYSAQVREHLGTLLDDAGFASVLADVDLGEVARRTDEVTQAMIDCVPAGYVRIPGVGLRRVEASASS